jgi:hypothetical protein
VVKGLAGETYQGDRHCIILNPTKMYNASEAHGILIKGRNIEYRGESIPASEVIGAICQANKKSNVLNTTVKHDPAKMLVSIMVDPFDDDVSEVDIITYQQFCNLYPYIIRWAIATLKK